MSASRVSFRRLFVWLLAMVFAVACLAPPTVEAKEKKDKTSKKTKTRSKSRKGKKEKKEKKEKEDKEDQEEKAVIEDEDALLTVLNTADAKVLVTLRGVGKKLAEGIVAKRPYKDLDGLLEVEGIAKKRLERIKANVGKAKVPASVLEDEE